MFNQSWSLKEYNGSFKKKLKSKIYHGYNMVYFLNMDMPPFVVLGCRNLASRIFREMI